MWRDTHEKTKAKHIRKDDKKNLNLDQTWEFNYRCGMCGFAGCDLRRDSVGMGDGYVLDNSSGTLEQKVTSGCPQCGSRNWL